MRDALVIQRWEYAEFGYGGSGEHELREVWFSHRETWPNRPVDPSETLRALGDLGFELVNVTRYPRVFDAELFIRRSRFTMRMKATSSFYLFKRPLEESAQDPADERDEGEDADRTEDALAIGDPSQY